MVIDDLLAVLEQQAVELVGEQVDGGVHVDRAGVGMQGAAGEVDGGLGEVVGLVDAELGAHVERLLEVAPEPPQLAFDVVAQGGGGIDLLTPVPEPSQWLIALAGLGLLAARISRRYG